MSVYWTSGRVAVLLQCCPMNHYTRMKMALLVTISLATFLSAALAVPWTPGPGAGAFQSMDPSAFGMNADDLKAAADESADAALYRYCTVIVKNGYIVHEQYHHNNSETLYESDSMGKTATAAAIGVAVYQGLIDLDKPIIEYNLSSDMANWSATGVDYFKVVTTRHILSQASGYGRVAPGSFFTYDSDNYIQYLSYVLQAVTGELPAVWATRELAAPLGIPNLYTFDELDGQISAGGGQMYTCQDAARVGAFITSLGLTVDENGNPKRLVGEDYMKMMFQPSYPQNNAAYGFLTWLNTDVEEIYPGVHCCAPRWGHDGYLCTKENGTGHCASCCAPRDANNQPAPVTKETAFCNTSSTTLNEANADVVVHPGQPRDEWMLRVGSAYIGKKMIGDNMPGTIDAPSDMGIAMGWAARYIIAVPSENLTIISIGTSEGWATDCWGGYDDAYTLALVWNTLAKAVRPSKPPTKPSPKPVTLPVVRDLRKPKEVEQPPPGEEFVGSCSCTCSPGEGFGKCFNVPSSKAPKDMSAEKGCYTIPGFETDKDSFYHKNADYCGMTGFPKQCNYPADKDVDLCTLPPSKYEKFNCSTVRKCAPVAGNSALATVGCSCFTTNFDRCIWSNSTCDYSPYFPPGRSARSLGANFGKHRKINKKPINSL
eukprot:m.335179 g.335179  ORF g.335179 m.335179 type:complete len:657 (+) comp17530_c0_seq1:36-2006(+)